jgi:hypothetical protein
LTLQLPSKACYQTSSSQRQIQESIQEQNTPINRADGLRSFVRDQERADITQAPIPIEEVVIEPTPQAHEFLAPPPPEEQIPIFQQVQ